jgi:hypothetical protein
MTSGSGYPYGHYDEDDTCECPDHAAMRVERREQELAQEPFAMRLLRRVLGNGF